MYSWKAQFLVAYKCEICTNTVEQHQNRERVTLPDEQSESSDNQSSSAGPMAHETAMV
jgi:hypothetical protein